MCFYCRSILFLKDNTRWEQMWTPGPSLWNESYFNWAEDAAILVKISKHLGEGQHSCETWMGPFDTSDFFR